MFMLVLFVFSFLLSYNGVEGSTTLSREEELEIENQLKLLNKPANKSIKTKHGDIYDCVDFYKQPAFDHPLLKNHNFHPQMRPSYARKGLKEQHSSTENQSSTIKLEGGGCPVGTVPIRRITKEDLIREKLASTNSIPTKYAKALTKSGPRFNGAGGKLSVYNLSVGSTSYSAGGFKLKSGPDAIQAGWRVDPPLYGDSLTRFFIHTDAGQSHCFNTRCPGFIIVNTDYPLDGIFDTVTQPGVTAYEITLSIAHDPLNGNWWLNYGKNSDQIGYWPKAIFTGLGDLALSVEWGGEVYSPAGSKNPPMGSGINPYIGGSGITDGNYPLYIAYISNLAVINEQLQSVDPKDLELDANSNSTYAVRDFGYRGDINKHIIIYGGSE